MPMDRVDQLPLPSCSLHWYAAFSGLSLFCVLMYGITLPTGLLSSLWNDLWCLAAMLNMGCCCLFLLASFIQSLVFGKLQLVEQQHMRDKFWNFVFYKFIFVFGVLNVQEMQAMMCWCVWFALLGTLLLTEQLCKDRFQLLSSSLHTIASTHAKIIVLLVTVFLACSGLFIVAAIVGWQYGFSHFTFLYSEVFVLFARTMHTIIRYVNHLWDMDHNGTWEKGSTYTYYTELYSSGTGSSKCGVPMSCTYADVGYHAAEYGQPDPADEAAVSVPGDPEAAVQASQLHVGQPDPREQVCPGPPRGAEWQ